MIHPVPDGVAVRFDDSMTGCEAMKRVVLPSWFWSGVQYIPSGTGLQNLHRRAVGRLAHSFVVLSLSIGLWGTVETADMAENPVFACFV